MLPFPARRTWLWTALLLAGCSGGDPAREPRVDVGVFPDQRACKRPYTIGSCIWPPHSLCADKPMCIGCTCTGSLNVYACDGFTGDCRWFCGGCYPASYTLCDKRAPQHILGLCSYCFADGGPPGKCDKMRPDAGAPRREAGSREAGLRDLRAPDRK